MKGTTNHHTTRNRKNNKVSVAVYGWIMMFTMLPSCLRTIRSAKAFQTTRRTCWSQPQVHSFVFQQPRTRFIRTSVVVGAPSETQALTTNNKLRLDSITKMITTGQHFFMAMEDTIEEEDTKTKTLTSTWNVGGLKKEVARLVFRCHKKIGKASTRVRQARATVEELLKDDNASMEDLENCPNVDALELELTELQDRLQKLNKLEEKLQGIKKKQAVLPEAVALLAMDLGVNDEPPARKPRGPTKKRKGPKLEPKRLPYRRYYTVDKTELRVGKQAADNDELSLSPKHRDGSDWWMHASGCPGSHVVIRCGDENLDAEVVQDAAALAARQSKCQGGTIKVSLTRCRHVTKPPGAKAGLVQLNGRVRTVSVNMKQAEARLDRLDETLQIN